jgi:hypothetical protein
MSNLLIIVNAKVKEGGLISASPATERMVAALKQAVKEAIFIEEAKSDLKLKAVQVETISAATLWSNFQHLKADYYCPLTIELPPQFKFPHQAVYQACKDVRGTRSWVEQNLGYKTSVGDYWLGDLWLPIVLTAKGPLYSEVIGEGEVPNSFQQPFDLLDKLRQSLYRLAYELLIYLKAPPAVYLLQFGLRDRNIVFDRLWPFPAAPAIASIGVQQPDLFACHWFCLTNRPISDLKIKTKL